MSIDPSSFCLFFHCASKSNVTAAINAFAAPQETGAKEEERAELWQADWDDEETTEDFQAKLKQELDRDMKE